MGRALLATDIRRMATILIAKHWLRDALGEKAFLYRSSLSYYPSDCDERPVPLTEQLTLLIPL